LPAFFAFASSTSLLNVSSSASSLPSSPSLTDYLPDILYVALFYHPEMLVRV